MMRSIDVLQMPLLTYQSYCALEERPLSQGRQCIEPDVLVSLITFSMIGTYYTY